MDIYLLLRIAVVGILVSILNQILKQSNRDELAFMTSLAGLILVLFWILPYITELFITIRDLLVCFRQEVGMVNVAVIGIVAVLVAILLKKEERNIHYISA